MKQTTPVISDGMKGRGDVEHGKTYDFYMSLAFVSLFAGPAMNAEGMWHIIGNGSLCGHQQQAQAGHPAQAI